ncbi:hypothetical protein RHMOL_Rhmol04G0169000 [Rhododendron molle]|uniref:Uncharacterized protein n=1 Tax=Rhododendron molle TaxID=49168 RepID=A0ACC0P2E1_RHOML|nr:hypothetical protein RHMOL_Rhmol04G0169000 [Rhododendron molle]
MGGSGRNYRIRDLTKQPSSAFKHRQKRERERERRTEAIWTKTTKHSDDFDEEQDRTKPTPGTAWVCEYGDEIRTAYRDIEVVMMHVVGSGL